MRKILFITLGLLCLCARAIPADPTPVKVTQPDGSTLTIKLHGDEFFHFTTTHDGYTVLKNNAGYYTYAQLSQGRLVPGDRIAKDLSQRTAADVAALAAIPKGLTDQASLQSGQRRIGARNSAMRRVGADGMFDYDKFRGLIILINYKNKKFSMSNPSPSEFYNDMVNTHDYTGYTLRGRHVDMTGSVRDYFYDNSAHVFDPSFDVVGPVTVNYYCTDPHGTDNADAIFNAALDSIDATVDFSDYDTDGDGYVDMVFFLVAGFSANYGGNNENYLWPHMYYLYRTPAHDGVNFGLYACSTEIAGWENYWSDVNGIGTFCHEFGHVLGLPDLYDTDYSGSGGESRNPGEWSIMAGGSGNNFGRNPVGYSLYERYALGFAQPTLIDSGAEITLPPLDESNQGYRLNTPNKNEFFLIENRQSGKWDRYLPGHGMMIARVDSTDERIWWMNEVNCDPNHMYYELLRANYNGSDSGQDPFPGESGVTSINSFTKPSLLTWNKKFNDYAISDITENDNLITFLVQRDTSIITVVEDFENMSLTTDPKATAVQGVFSKWDFVKSFVESPEEGKCDGRQAVAMKNPSQITTSTSLAMIPYMLEYTIFNPTSISGTFRLSYSTDGGKNWNRPVDGTVSVSGKSSATVSVSLPTDAPLLIRINQTAGSPKASCYLDNIKLYYKDFWEPTYAIGDVNRDGEISISDINAVMNFILEDDSSTPTDHAADVNGDGEVNLADVNMIIDMILQ